MDAADAVRGRCTISGRVLVDGRGRAVEVAAWRTDVPEGEAWAVAPHQLEPAVGPSAAMEDGSFVIRNLPVGAYEVRGGRGSGLAGSSAGVVLSADGAHATVVLRLESVAGAESLSGIVTSVNGEPFIGLVGVARADPESYARSADPTTWEMTGPDGGFRVTGLEPGGVRLVAVLPGRLRVQSAYLHLPREAPFEFRLADIVRPLDVRVRSRVDGTAIDAARLWFTSSDRSCFGAGDTDSAGRCTLLCGTREGTLEISAAGYPRATVTVEEDAQSCDVRLGRAATVRVRVKHRADGTAVPGVAVHVSRSGGQRLWSDDDRVVTGRDGVAVFDTLLPGEAHVFVRGEGWFSEGLEPDVRSTEDPFFTSELLPVAPPEWIPREGTLELELRVFRGAAVRGRVVGPGDAPIVGAVVGCEPVVPMPDLGLREGWSDSVATDDDGRYAFAGLYPGVEYRFTAEAPGLLASEPVLVHAAEGTQAEDIQLIAGGWIDVRVVESGSGRPLSGAEVRVQRESARRSIADPNWSGPRLATDADGRVRVGPHPAGRFLVWAAGPDHPPCAPLAVDVRDVGSIDVTLSLGPGSSIRGGLVPPEGSSIDAGSVVVFPVDDGPPYRRETSVGPDGSFAIGGLRHGKQRVIAHAWTASSNFEGEVVAPSGEGDVRVHLEPFERPDWDKFLRRGFEIRVVDPSGFPVAAGQYEAGHGRGGEGGSFDGGVIYLRGRYVGGTLVLRNARDEAGLPLGLAALRSRLPDSVPSTPLVLRLPPEHTLSGRCVDQHGEPVRGVRVLARRPPASERERERRSWGEDVDPDGEALSGRDGRFTVHDLDSEPYEVEFQPPPEYLPLPERLTLSAGAADIEVRLERSRRTVIVVLDADGQPVARARVSVDQRGRLETAAQGETDPAGRVRLPALAPTSGERTYRLRVVPPRDREDLLDLSVDQWEPIAESTVRLEAAHAIAGTVVDPAGAPVGEVAVWSRIQEAEPTSDFSHWTRTVTDAAGAFRVTGLHAAEYQFVAGNFSTSRTGFNGMDVSPRRPEELVPHLRTVPSGSDAVRLELPAQTVLRLRIDGLPAHTALEEPPRLDDAESSSDGLVSSATQDRAVFLFSGLVPGQAYRTLVRVPAENLFGFREDLRSGTTGTLRLGSGHVLEGRCVFPEGVEASRINVRFHVLGRTLHADTQRDGSFSIPALPLRAGRLEVWAIVAGRDIEARATATPGTPVELTLKSR